VARTYRESLDRNGTLNEKRFFEDTGECAPGLEKLSGSDGSDPHVTDASTDAWEKLEEQIAWLLGLLSMYETGLVAGNLIHPPEQYIQIAQRLWAEIKKNLTALIRVRKLRGRDVPQPGPNCVFNVEYLSRF
jgi:hypothetical protein